MHFLAHLQPGFYLLHTPSYGTQLRARVSPGAVTTESDFRLQFQLKISRPASTVWFEIYKLKSAICNLKSRHPGPRSQSCEMQIPAAIPRSSPGNFSLATGFLPISMGRTGSVVLGRGDGFQEVDG
jgi:hypothetical protein